MEFKITHTNINVLDLEKSLIFYKEALGLVEQRRHTAADGSFVLVYLGDGTPGGHQIELTWLANRTEPYNLGDNESHIAFTTTDMAAAHEKHEKMDCICYENPTMGIYFIHDPDDYWLEILPRK